MAAGLRKGKQMELINTPKEHIPVFRELYGYAFPKNEQMPFDALLRRKEKGYLEFLSLTDDNEFIGMMVVASHNDKVLLNYFAIDEKCRGGGYGSRALGLLKERIGDKHLFLDIELVTSDAPNLEQRERRKAFYMRNGFVQTSLRFRMFGERFEMLSDGQDIDIRTLRVMLTKIFGKLAGLVLRFVLRPLK
ncbi:MAG: GNAT family N-acetyltransferase [Christensenella sp.]|uniref:GNAT family N-acetyltransferase n=1 Tax=Christensenella sp. TaxID=1935934 RepID=UPI002B1F100D|nr:GNAT family N-acetyltransferase [Christensenella sp.]MEA5003134.1 GNAT family N-acetyltransferase [Christensenella sp.]